MNEIKKEPEVTGIFPLPIYKGFLNRPFTDKEINFFEKSKEDNYRNAGNTTSKDNYILNNKELKNLKTDLTKIVEHFFTSIINPSENIIPYITQSWLNWTKAGEFHHKHNHPNSIISGVFYINADDKVDSIEFFNERYDQIAIEPKQLNVFNAKGATFQVGTGLVILFPSWLNHSVNIKSGENLRTSLAFNTFLRGTIGSDTKLFELKL